MFRVKFQFSKLVSVAEETSLSLTLSKTQKTDFVASRSIYEHCCVMQANNKGTNLVDWDFTSVQGFFNLGKEIKCKRLAEHFITFLQQV